MNAQLPPTHDNISIAKLIGRRPRVLSVTMALVVVNVGVFAVMLGFGAGLWHAPIEVQLAWGANFGPATQDGAWWRLVTAMFLHFGLLHLAMNMWALWDGGPLVERFYGPGRFALLYLASGVTGNLLSLAVHGSDAVSGGASGAIFGVYGALLVCLLHERRRLDPLEFKWLFGGAAVFAVATLVMGVFVRGIDNAAHLGGLAGGALLGALLLRPFLAVDRVPVRGRVAAATALVAGLMLLVAHIPPPHYYLREELAAQDAIRSFVDGERQLGERWKIILEDASLEGPSFEALAGRIDEDIARGYRDSFAHLSAVNVAPGAPSAATLDALRLYSQRRGDASHALAEALRSGDSERVRSAVDALHDASPPALEVRRSLAPATTGAASATRP